MNPTTEAARISGGSLEKVTSDGRILCHDK